jgi:hypothetical protein
VPEKPTSSESKLRGSLVTKVVEDAGSLVVSRLKGSLLRGSEGVEARLVPEDYDLPDSVAEQIRKKTEAEDLTLLEDPNGVIMPGRLFISAHDPSHRRLITNVYATPRGSTIATVHIEGEPMLRTHSMADIQRRIDEGALVPPSPSK